MAGVRVRGEGRGERESTGMQSFVFWVVLRSLTHKVLGSDTTASQQRQEANETLDEPDVP
jgi:hypothetical protein